MSTTSIIAPKPPNDGRDWDCQCARCGSSVLNEPCDSCGGDGVSGHDCGEDCCMCLDPVDNMRCDICDGAGQHITCISDPEWCDARPIERRKDTARGAIEWFTFDAPPKPAITVADVLRCLTSNRFDASTEERLQTAIAQALSGAGLELVREVVLSPGSRIDFLSANGIGIEVKIDGSETSVLRQLMRYAESDRVTALVLFTTRSKHLNMPDTLRGKPLSVYFQGGI